MEKNKELLDEVLERIEKFRDHGYSIEDIAAKVGFSWQTLHRWIKGKVNPFGHSLEMVNTKLIIWEEENVDRQQVQE